MPKSRASSRIFPAIARLFARVDVRLVLSAAIIVSLLPFEWVERLDGVFLALFGLEFLLRAALLFRSEEGGSQPGGISPSEAEREANRGWRWPKPSALVLLAFDLLALLSFIDFRVESNTAIRWLRLFRLSRMLLLLSYWAPLVRDVWSVVGRTERTKQIALMGFIVLVLSFAGAVIVEHASVVDGQQVAIDFDGDGEIGQSDRGFFTHLWWSFRQVQDPGNMLSSPHEAAAVLVSLALTVVGLFMVSFLIGLGTDVVRELMELTRLRPPGLRGHTIVVNIDPSTQQLLHELMRYSKKLLPVGRLTWPWVRQLVRNTKRGLQGAHYVIVGRNHDPPDFLRLPELSTIVYRQGKVDDETFLVRTDIVEAQRVVLLADRGAPDPDAETIQALLTVTESLREADAKRGYGPERALSKRARLLIAEVLDESNVPAAHTAIRGDGKGHTRAFVIPTERLIALFVACLVRRPGIDRLLGELLTSSGHELYTCFFDDEGLGFRPKQTRSLPADPGEFLVDLRARARALSGPRVVPIGVLLRCEGTSPSLPAEPAPLTETSVHLNPRPPDPTTEAASEAETTDASPCRGFIAIAANFTQVQRLADSTCRGEELGASTPAGASTDALPEFELVETQPLDKVLVCGFRSSTVSLVEALIMAAPHIQILIMVADADARERALDDFDAHTRLVERGMLGGEHGRFHRIDAGSKLRWFGRSGEHGGRPHVTLTVGDWSSSRRLADLVPGESEFGSVAELDAVIMISAERAGTDARSGADARTAKTLMKLQTLVAAAMRAEGAGARPPRVVAEVLDVELARRLRRRALNSGTDWINVYSVQELRAFFMFQSVVVPAFDLVYAELMSPWGQSFIEVRPREPVAGETSFELLADHLAEQGYLLCAVELQHPSGRRVAHVAEGDPERHDAIPLERLCGAWVIADEGSPPAG